MFPHLQETSMNKTIQKKVDLNVILTVFIRVHFGHQQSGTREKWHIRGYSRLILEFKMFFSNYVFSQFI